jgi:TetR/AcrR family transcriptional repressor of uid operon
MRTKGTRNKSFPERQDAVLRAAEACFARRGFHATSMREICAEANMSPGALYRYFPAKEDIVAALIEADRARWAAAMDALSADLGLIAALHGLAEMGLADLQNEAFLSIWVETYAEAARSPKVARTMAESYSEFETRLAVLVEAAQRKREIASTDKPLPVARLILAAFDGLLLRRCFDPDLDTRRLTKEFLSFIECALGAGTSSQGGRS